MTDKKMQVISCTFNRAVGCFVWFPSTTNPPPYTTPMQPPTGASATTCALLSLDLAPSDQLCLFDGHMIYNFHVTFQFLVTWCMPSCSLTNHTLSCCMVRHLLKFYLRWALCSLSWLSFIFNLPVLTVQHWQLKREFPPQRFRFRKFVQPDCFAPFSPTCVYLTSYLHHT